MIAYNSAILINNVLKLCCSELLSTQFDKWVEIYLFTCVTKFMGLNCIQNNDTQDIFMKVKCV